MVSPGAERLPPVAAIRSAMDRERAARALAGLLALPPDQDPGIPRALLERLRWVRDGSRRPWLTGIAMVGSNAAPWRGVGAVVKQWSSTRTCSVWRKEYIATNGSTLQPMLQWRSHVFDIHLVALAIYAGHLTDAYP